jgi:hypothetical protein
MITGSGRVSPLSDRIRRYRVRFSFATWVRAHDRWATAPAVWATRALGRRLGLAEDSAQKPNSNKKTFFFFKAVL